MQVVARRMIASVGPMILGSSRSSTRTSPGECITTPFMYVLLCVLLFRVSRARVRASVREFDPCDEVALAVPDRGDVAVEAADAGDAVEAADVGGVEDEHLRRRVVADLARPRVGACRHSAHRQGTRNLCFLLLAVEVVEGKSERQLSDQRPCGRVI